MNLREAIKKYIPIWAGLMVLAFVTYGNSMGNDFLSDDLNAIPNSRTISNLSATITSTWHVDEIWKAVLYKINGARVEVYHFNNIFFHALTAFMVYLLARYLIRENDGDEKTAQGIGIISAVLFALHPIHTEAVTWISGRPYVMYSFLLIVVFLLFCRIEKYKLNYKYTLLGVILGIILVRINEKAVVLPVLFGLFLWLFRDIKKGLKALAAISTVVAVFVLAMIGPLLNRAASVGGGSTSGGIEFMNPLLQIPAAVGTYSKLLIWPLGLTLYHEDLILTSWRYVLYLLFTLAVFGTLWWVWRKKNRLATFLLAWILISLIPTLLPIKISWVVAERYIYLGSVGFAILTAYGLWIIKKKNEGVFWLTTTALCGFYLIVTIGRNAEWKSQDTLWPATLRESPTSSLAYNNMGDYWARHGDLQKSAESFAAAVQLRPNYSDALYNLGNTLLQMGDASQSAYFFNLTMKSNPTLIEPAIGLAQIAIMNDDLKGAEQMLNKAQSINPNSPLLYNAWAVLYYKEGDKQKAIELINKTLSIDPEFLPAKRNLEIINNGK